MKKTIIKAIVVGLLAALGVISAALGLTACNVTRVVTNESSYFQRGDTAVTITIKTVETYEGTKK